jgi:hypothetical protein
MLTSNSATSGTPRLDARHGVIGAVGDTNIMAEQGQEPGERVGHIRNIIDYEDVCHKLGACERLSHSSRVLKSRATPRSLTFCKTSPYLDT